MGVAVLPGGERVEGGQCAYLLELPNGVLVCKLQFLELQLERPLVLLGLGLARLKKGETGCQECRVWVGCGWGEGVNVCAPLWTQPRALAGGKEGAAEREALDLFQDPPIPTYSETISPGVPPVEASAPSRPKTYSETGPSQRMTRSAHTNLLIVRPIYVCTWCASS